MDKGIELSGGNVTVRTLEFGGIYTHTYIHIHIMHTYTARIFASHQILGDSHCDAHR